MTSPLENLSRVAEEQMQRGAVGCSSANEGDVSTFQKGESASIVNLTFVSSALVHDRPSGASTTE